MLLVLVLPQMERCNISLQIRREMQIGSRGVQSTEDPYINSGQDNIGRSGNLCHHVKLSRRCKRYVMHSGSLGLVDNFISINRLANDAVGDIVEVIYLVDRNQPTYTVLQTSKDEDIIVSPNLEM